MKARRDRKYTKRRSLFFVPSVKNLLLLTGVFLAACQAEADYSKIESQDQNCLLELIVLGIGQDAGAPQIGYQDDPAWSDPDLRLLPTSIAIVDHNTSERILFEATPSITRQLQRLDAMSTRSDSSLGIDGVFLTHAHIGHYAGLIYFGREVAGASNLPVYVMPRFKDYLSKNGPWDQLVALDNINLSLLTDRQSVSPIASVKVTPFQVPHRDEYSETVGYKIETTGKDVFFLPDIDSWDEWDADFKIKIEDMVSRVDYAFLDATFFDNHELPGRDMSKIPHPRVVESMDRLQHLSETQRAGVHFIHMNHSNPIRFADSDATKLVSKRGFSIAREGQRLCLTSE